MPWIDIHNHLQHIDFVTDIQSIINESISAGIIFMGVNGTCKDDWGKVIQLSKESPAIIPFLGIHPWSAKESSEKDLEVLESYLTQYPILGVGEIGLDKQKHLPNIDIQKTLFTKQLELAQKYQRPVSIHCHKAWGKLIDVFKSAKLPQAGILLHAFSGSIETVRELNQWKQIFFSISPALCNPKYQKLRALIPQLPLDRILLESDAPNHKSPITGTLNTPHSIIKVAKELASIHNTSLKNIENLTAENTKRYLSQFGTPPFQAAF